MGSARLRVGRGQTGDHESESTWPVNAANIERAQQPAIGGEAILRV